MKQSDKTRFFLFLLFLKSSHPFLLHRSNQCSSVRNISRRNKNVHITHLNLIKSKQFDRYDATNIISYYDRRPWEVIWRLNALGLPLLSWYWGLLLDELLKVDKLEGTQRKRGVQLRYHLIHSNSVAFIKSGQALSLRPDLLKNKIWAEELSKLVDAVDSFPDEDAMKRMSEEYNDMKGRLEAVVKSKTTSTKSISQKNRRGEKRSKAQKIVENDLMLGGLFEFYNDNKVVASASIGQVYKARIRRGKLLEAAIGKKEAAKWGGKIVAIKVQRPGISSSAALDMYLIRRAVMWLSTFRGGNLPAIADQFGVQLFQELDYVREADSCERFCELYGNFEGVVVPSACTALTRKRVLVQEWVDGEKGPWKGDVSLSIIKTGLKCSVDQLMNTGLFHADPHRGNLLKTPDDKLAFLDFGMMSDVTEEERYGLIGLTIGLQNKNLPLVTENLLKLGFLEDTKQIDELIPRLRLALINSTGGTGKASDVNFAQLQAELDNISRENLLRFNTPPFFTVVIRSLTILEGFALSVDKNFRLVRGSYPYVLAQLLSPSSDQRTPVALTDLLQKILTVDGRGERIEWDRLLSLLRLAQKASSKNYDRDEANLDEEGSARQTIELFYKFLTSKAGLFLKTPLVHELAEAIDGMASTTEMQLMRITGGLIRPLPGGLGPVNEKRMDEIRNLLSMVQDAVSDDDGNGRLIFAQEVMQGIVDLARDDKRRKEVEPILAEAMNVIQMVAVEVLELRGKRAMRTALQLSPI